LPTSSLKRQKSQAGFEIRTRRSSCGLDLSRLLAFSREARTLQPELKIATYSTATYNLQTMSDEKWYKDGLRFKCTQCGNCCSGPEGYVWVNDEEIEKIAEFIGKPVDEMKDAHTRQVGKRTSLKEFASGDCTFLHPTTRGCTIYPVRPRQCRTWPFWNSNLEHPESWQAAQQVCPGAGKGNFFSLEEIEAQAAIIRL